jgi:hypothetical protein
VIPIPFRGILSNQNAWRIWNQKRREPVQIKLFDKKLVDLAHLEADINQWLTANPKLVTIQRDFHVYHNHTTREESVLVAMWYEPKSGM